MDSALIVVGVILAVGVFGLWRSQVDGKAKAAKGPRLAPEQLGGELGESATLVQFSTAFCAPCRTARVVLQKVADTVPGVKHVEIDAEDNLDLVRQLDIMRTPTTLLLDSKGQIRNRVTGVPQTPELLSAIAAVKG